MTRAHGVQATHVGVSNVDEVVYDAELRDLYILYSGGETHVFSDVEPKLYEGLVSALSFDRYLNKHVKPGRAWRRLSG